MDLMTALANVCDKMPEEGEAIVDAIDSLTYRLHRTTQFFLRISRQVALVSDKATRLLKDSQAEPEGVREDPTRTQATTTELRSRLQLLDGGKAPSPLEAPPALRLAEAPAEEEEGGLEDLD